MDAKDEFVLSIPKWEDESNSEPLSSEMSLSSECDILFLILILAKPNSCCHLTALANLTLAGSVSTESLELCNESRLSSFLTLVTCCVLA